MKISPSLKIKITRTVADNLEGQSWPDIDLELNAFGFPKDLSDSGERRAYIINRVSEGNDSSLYDIAKHYEIPLGETTVGKIPEFWGSGHVKLFISHLTIHRELAHDIKSHLSRYGISSFVAHDDIEPTKEWQEQIELALSTADLGIALLHTGFNASKWCPMEIGWLLGRGRMVVSIKLDADPFGFLGKTQAFNAKGKDAKSISNGLLKLLLSKEDMAELVKNACCRRLLSAESYIEAIEVTQTMQLLKPFDADQRKMVESALEKNSQVYNSVKASALAKQLLR